MVESPLIWMLERTKMPDVLRAILQERLRSSGADSHVSAAVLAAFEGANRLADALAEGKEAVSTPADVPAAKPISPPVTSRGGAWLTGVRVEGFRGVAQPLELDLAPGPGLVLVTGRNGSGKSSLAEAAELALLGTSDRARMPLWAQGLKNLHYGGATTVNVAVLVDGLGELQIGRTLVDDGLAGSTAWAKDKDTHVDLGALGWDDAVSRYRPVLTYSELAQLSAGQPSALFDPLNRILGLEALTEADAVLRSAEAQHKLPAKDADARRKSLIGLLKESGDERAAQLISALEKSVRDIEVLRVLLDERKTVRVTAVGAAPEWSELRAPAREQVEAASSAVAQAHADQEQEAASQARRSERLATLLNLAVEHRQGADDLCPVCGKGKLDESWLTRARAEIEQQTASAKAARSARARREAAVLAARRLISPVPAVLREPAVAAIDPGPALTAWCAWEAAGHPDVDETVLAVDLPRLAAELSEAVAELSAAAAAVLAEEDRKWQPLLQLAVEALHLADRAAEAAPRLQTVKAARAWLKAASEEIRSERLRPFAEQAMRIWADLRQESNVSLGGVTLVGQNTRRQVQLDLDVDGVPGPRAVLSQGELAALGLALFLPRSVAEESLFRFVIIDDPVQSLDPSKVDGLARVLHSLSADRQVVVFTHDNRLPKSLRHLDLQFTHYQIDRGERSVVSAEKVSDPVLQHLKDGEALAKDVVLPPDLLALAVAGYCRDAVEEAAMEVARRRLIVGGKDVKETDAALEAAGTTRGRLGLAVMADRWARRRDLDSALLALGGTKELLDRFVDAVHEPDASEDLLGLLADVTGFVKALRGIA